MQFALETIPPFVIDKTNPQGGLPYLHHNWWVRADQLDGLLPFGNLDAVEVGTDRDSVRSLRSGVWVENPEVETQSGRFQETIPARPCAIRRGPSWRCSDCGGKDAECQEDGLSE